MYKTRCVLILMRNRKTKQERRAKEEKRNDKIENEEEQVLYSLFVTKKICGINLDCPHTPILAVNFITQTIFAYSQTGCSVPLNIAILLVIL